MNTVIFPIFPNDAVEMNLSPSHSSSATALATPPLTTLAPTPIPKERQRIRRLARKSGNPQRSCSWTDASPGILFKMLPAPQILAAFPQCILRTVGTSSTKAIDAPKPKRNRSFSVSSLSPNQSQLCLVRSRRFSADIISVTESGDEEEDDASDAENTTSLLNNPSQLSRGLKKVSNLTNSLAHLVPNSLLMSLSRRVSAHGSAEGCRCSSCGITVTPYWRDGWADNVMLCNACGLRFQKFAQRCRKCHYIPRKEDNVAHVCPQCNAAWEC